MDKIGTTIAMKDRCYLGTYDQILYDQARNRNLEGLGLFKQSENISTNNDMYFCNFLLQSYLKKYAYENAVSDDLWAEITQVSLHLFLSVHVTIKSPMPHFPIVVFVCMVN